MATPPPAPAAAPAPGGLRWSPRALAVAVVAGPLVVFGAFMAVAVAALPPAAGTPALAADTWWWLAAVLPGLLLAAWVLRGPGALPPTAVPGNVVAAVGIGALALAMGLGGCVHLLLVGPDRPPGAAEGLAVYAVQFAAAALPAWLVSGPPGPRGRWRAPLLGIAGWAAVFPLANVALIANQWLLHAAGRAAETQAVLREYHHAGAWDRAVYAVTVVACAPVLEEVVFRAAIYRGLRGLSGVWPATLGSSLLFTAIHGAPAQALPIFVLGVMLALCYERAGTLGAPIAAHGLHNGLALALTGLG